METMTEATQKTSGFTKEEKIALAKILLNDRLENYGYDWADFRRLMRQRYEAKKAFKHALGGLSRNSWNEPFCNIESMNFDNIMGGRLCIYKGHPEYITGQSNNEEITNCMRQLVNRDAKWLS